MIKKSIFASLCFIIVASGVEAACDCNHFPWNPKSCKDFCGALVVSQANQAELQTFLKLDESLAQRILQLRQSQPGEKLNSLKPIESQLGEAEYKELIQAFENLKPLEAQYLVQSPEKKENFRAMVMQTNPSTLKMF